MKDVKVMYRFLANSVLSSRRAAVSAAICAGAACVALLAGCANTLLEEARDVQAREASPRLVLSTADGGALTSGGGLDFGAVSVGGSLSLTLTIKNSGATDLVIDSSGISITPASGTDVGVFSAADARALSIKAGESATLTILFSPLAATGCGAMAIIESNDVEQPSFTVNLSGSGSSTAKAFTSFGIQSPLQSGAIDEDGKKISLNVPFGTSVTGLVAVFESTGERVLVGSTVQTSGQTSNDFTAPVTYTVVAQNGSKAEYEVIVSVGSVVPILTTGAIGSISLVSAVGSGTVVAVGDESGEVAECGLCWSTAASPTVADAHAASAMKSGTFTNLSLTGLSPGTTYYVRAYATNSVGTGYGAPVSFTTVAATVPTLTTGAIGSISLVSAVGSGTVVAVGDESGEVAECGLCWSTAASPTVADAHSASAMKSGTFTNLSLTGLSPGTTYYVRAYATNSVGTGYGAPVSFTTAAATVPTLTTGAIGSILSNSAAGSGTLVSVGDGGSEVSEFGLCWSTAPNPTLSDSHASSAMNSGTFTNLPLSGLSSGTTYYVRAYATNSVGTGYGAQMSFITVPAAPSAPTVATVGGIAGSGQLAVSWLPAAGAASYNVYANTINSRPSDPASGGSGVSGTSCVLTGLSNYSAYYVWVIAANGSGASGASTPSTGSVGVKATAVAINKNAVKLFLESSETLSVSFTTASGLAPTEPGVVWSSSTASSVSVGSSTGTLTGVAAGSATITATCPASAVSATSAATVAAYSLGATGPAGGKLFYDKGSYSNGWRYLEASSSEIGYGTPWSPLGAFSSGYYSVAGAYATEIGTGKENTDAIIAYYAPHHAAYGTVYQAYLCAQLTEGGYQDWFLPSQAELQEVSSKLGFSAIGRGFFSSTDAGFINSYVQTDLSTNNGTYVSGSARKDANNYYYRPIRRF